MIDSKSSRKVRRERVVKVTIGQQSKLILDSRFDGKPVEINKKWCNVVSFALSEDDSRGTVLHPLQATQLFVRQARQVGVAKIKPRGDRR